MNSRARLTPWSPRPQPGVWQRCIARRRRHQTRTGAARGFSLVELLLVVALLLLLLGAVVFNFSTLQRGAELDEGARQLESLLRYARAHAASSGRQVRINFEEDAGDGYIVPLGNLDVTWEPDPLGQPGIFQRLPETADYVKTVLDIISIEKVAPLNSSVSSTDSSAPASAAPSENAAPPPAVVETAAFNFAPITFYPDGSSDSAEITIALRHGEDDPRQVRLQLIGLTGLIRKQVLAVDPAMGVATEPPANDVDFEDFE